MASSPYAGQTLASTAQVDVSQVDRWTDVSFGSSLLLLSEGLPVFILCLCLQTASQLDSVGQVDIKYEDYPFPPASMTSPHSWCALSQA